MASDVMTNDSLQAEEIEALSAIFGEDWTLESNLERSYSLNIKNTSNDVLYFKVTLPKDYPLESPPTYVISAPWMNRTAKAGLDLLLDDIYCDNIGESILYLWITKIQDFINEPAQVQKIVSSDEENITTDILDDICQQVEEELFLCVDELPEVHHGEPIIDRKSVFQAHLANVVSVDQVNQVLQKLKENRKIAVATHNIFAYRIERGNEAFIQDCEDDGEHKAGSILLHLLQVLDVSNVLVVVSRWYGGIHLGPDRFKHINNAARILLNNLGYLTNKSKDSGSEKSKKHKFPHKT